MNERKIEMPIALITDAEVIFEGQRKPRPIEVRVDLVAEIRAIENDAAPVVASAHLAPCQALRRLASEQIDFRCWNGLLHRKSQSPYNGPQKETLDIDEALLRRILAAPRGEVIPHNFVLRRDRGTSPMFERSWMQCQRNAMPTLPEVAAAMPIREVVDDGIAQANRQAKKALHDIVLIDGVLHQRTVGPLYAVFQPYGLPRQVIVPSGGLTDYRGALLFGPNRADDAQVMCEWLSKRDRKGVSPRLDVIEIVDPDLLAVNEAEIVVRNNFSGSWSAADKLFPALPMVDLMRWARLRDLEISVRSGYGDNAVAAMVAFRDFINGVTTLSLAPHYDDLRDKYLKTQRDSIHRVLDVELPRLGIGPEQGPIAPVDEDALDDMAAVIGVSETP